MLFHRHKHLLRDGVVHALGNFNLVFDFALERADAHFLNVGGGTPKQSHWVIQRVCSILLAFNFIPDVLHF